MCENGQYQQYLFYFLPFQIDGNPGTCRLNSFLGSSFCLLRCLLSGRLQPPVSVFGMYHRNPADVHRSACRYPRWTVGRPEDPVRAHSFRLDSYWLRFPSPPDVDNVDENPVQSNALAKISQGDTTIVILCLKLRPHRLERGGGV